MKKITLSTLILIATVFSMKAQNSHKLESNIKTETLSFTKDLKDNPSKLKDVILEKLILPNTIKANENKTLADDGQEALLINILYDATYTNKSGIPSIYDGSNCFWWKYFNSNSSRKFLLHA